MRASIEKITQDTPRGPITVKVKPNDEYMVNNLLELGFTKDSEHVVYSDMSTPLEKFMKILTGLFNKEEAKIVDQIETDKVTKALTEQLNSLVSKAE